MLHRRDHNFVQNRERKVSETKTTTETEIPSATDTRFTMKPIKVTLDHGYQSRYASGPITKDYSVQKITGDCLVEVNSTNQQYHVGDRMGETEAKELCTDSRYEVTVVPRKYE
jgi:hypothetical protein